jgi:hypothetical protein
MMLSARQFEPPWERWLKLDPLFAAAGCLPSKPLALIGARQMAQKTTPGPACGPGECAH